VRFVRDDDSFYNDNQEVTIWANKEINHANRAGAPRDDFESSMTQAKNVI